MDDQFLDADGVDHELHNTQLDRSPPRSISAADRVRDAILTSEMAPGTRINEVHLARALGVSRTPIRSALHSLAAEGLVDYAQNRGFSVRDFPPQAVQDAYEIRATLEGLACRFAAERGLGDADREMMLQALREGDELLEHAPLNERDLVAYRAINIMFHDAILNAAQNRMLTEAVRLTLNMPGATQRNIVAFHHEDVRRRHDDHHRIFALIASGRGYRAEAIMREHVLGLSHARKSPSI
jgi:GntR family transcriptional regulator of vanillate catabolism